ncbi:MAG: polymer-forming cytoskeletal protein [Lachnospiraceae bacterium]|nr:polymer-forming cytoskeletal protein [Lachnospiraceae bacterium]
MSEKNISVITKGMTIHGDIISDQGLEVIGEVKGNIKIAGPLIVSGTVTGDMEAGDVTGSSAKIIGDIVSSGTVNVGSETVIIGNINGKAAQIAGAVKGDIDVKGDAVLESSAIINGDIRSRSVSIKNGAVIEGHCSQTYADVSPADFFKNLIKK